MRAILVDDESLALRDLERQLLKIGGVDIAGCCQDPFTALRMAAELGPDVVFLDIEMPGMTGIETAEKLHAVLPDAHIVFVTAYDEYAVKAFELNAVDYLLKPLQSERLRTTIARLAGYGTGNNQTAGPKSSPPLLGCFHSLQYEGQPLSWRTVKAQELFAYLLHQRGRQVRKEELLELLWAESGQKNGMTQMYTAIYQVRKTLQAGGIDVEVVSTEKCYMLDLKATQLDADEWERAVHETAAPSEDTLPAHKRLLELYRGDYFANYDYLWAENERERLRLLWFQHAIGVADFMAGSAQPIEALRLYQRIQQAFPYAEETYWGLMKLHYARGDQQAVQKQYDDLNKILAAELGMAPQTYIREWYERHMSS